MALEEYALRLRDRLVRLDHCRRELHVDASMTKATVSSLFADLQSFVCETRDRILETIGLSHTTQETRLHHLIGASKSASDVLAAYMLRLVCYY